MADDLVGFDTNQYAEACAKLNWLFPESKSIKVEVVTTTKGVEEFQKRLNAMILSRRTFIVSENKNDIFANLKFLNVTIEVKEKSGAF